MLNHISSILQQRRYIKSVHIVLILGILSFINTKTTNGASQPSKQSLEIAWQYYRQTCDWDSSAIHIGIKNTSENSVELKKITINGKILDWPKDLPDPTKEIEASKKKKRWYFPSGVKAGDVMWFRFSRRIVPSGELTELIVKFQKPPQKPVELEIETTNGQVIQATIEPKVPPISISAITFSETLSTVYTYVKNLSSQTLLLESISINGQDKTANSGFVNQLIPSGGSGCIVSPVSNVKQGDYVYIGVKTQNGIVIGNSIRAFSCFMIPGENEKIEMKKFTENPYGQLDLVARQIIQNQPELLGQEMFNYWSNQGFIKYGIMAFGELVDCAVVHCQPTEVEYLGKYRPSDSHYVQAKTRYIREALAPRPLFPQTEIHHALMGDYLQGLLSPVEMRLRVYYIISRGAKGIFYRGKLEDESTLEQQKILRCEMDKIQKELVTLKSLLQIGENVDGLAACAEPLVEPSVLLCGNKAIILILFNHDRQMSWPQNEMYLGKSFWIEPQANYFEVDINIPPEVKVKQISEVGGKWSRPTFFDKKHNCRFKVDGIVDTRIFVLSFDNYVENKCLTQGIHGTLLKSINMNYENELNDIVPIDSQDDLKVKGRENNPWSPPILTQLQADVNGPDIQFEEKQYFFDHLSPSDKVYWHDFYYRNIGKQPLKITLLEAPNDIKVEIPKTFLSPKERGCVRAGFSSKDGKINSKILLKTNDNDEKEVRLEIGGNIYPDILAVPDRLHFVIEPLSGKNLKETVRLIDNSRIGLNIQNIVIDSNYLSCAISPVVEERIITKSYADIFNGEYIQREFSLAFSLEKEKIKESTHTSVTVITDNGGELHIPVTIEVLNPVICMPDRLFFGIINKPVNRSLKISSNDLLFEIGKVDFDSRNVKVNISEITPQKLYEITATITPSKQAGIIRGDIKIFVTCKNREYLITIPYFALVK